MIKNNAVIGSLLENLDQIEIIYKETYEPFKNDKGNTGDSKEYSVQEFIAAYLTNEYRVEKGSIYSQEGHSNNIDCVVLSPNHPMLTTPKRKIILAEGVYAAIEVKPNIKDKNEFKRALLQVKSIKKLNRKNYIPDFSKLMNKKPRPDFHNKIPSIIFASKSLSPKDLVSFIREKISSNIITIDDLPDIILTLDNGLFVFAPDITYTPFGPYFTEKNPQFSKTVLLHFCETEKSETLALFLLHFLNLPSPILKSQDFIINDYLKSVSGFKICGYDFGNNNSIKKQKTQQR